MADHSEYFDKVAQTVVDCDKDACLRLLDEGNDVDPLETLEKGLGKGIKQIGDDFGSGKVFLPELIGAADVMKAGVAVLDERIKASGKDRREPGKDRHRHGEGRHPRHRQVGRRLDAPGERV